LTVVVGRNESVACVIANVRNGTPEPPIPPIPPEPPVPGTPTADLAVTKTVTPTTVTSGDHVTATITVTNHGPDQATDVVVTTLSEPGASLVSVNPSQGTCANGTCQLGTIPSGGQATITVVARVTVAGMQTDTVLVRGSETDPVPTNNVAGAIVHVNGPFTPPLLRTCASLAVSPHSAIVGKTFLLEAHVSNARGKPIGGAPVQIHGVGINRLGRTDHFGVARFRVRARRAGLLRVRSGSRSICTARVGVFSRTPIPVTG
jgi:uncharacterized repeat protein (TIGR01451 family)